MLKFDLKNYTKKVYPMHMPGHKGGRFRLLENPYEVDVTEVDGTDHLYHPEGILRKSLEEASRFYQSKKTLYLVNGSTVGILASLYGVHEEGDHILVARNCHQSVHSAIALRKLRPTYVGPRITKEGLIGGIDPQDVKKKLVQNPNITSLIVTSPTYDGFVSDIESLVKICHRYNVLLIVDEAHGAHFPYASYFPKSAITCGADVVIHSLHKTLPTFTGSGMLHLNLPMDLEEGVTRALAIFQTSSPSYLMMAQMDACVKTLGRAKDPWISLYREIQRVHKALTRLKSLKILNLEPDHEAAIYAKDPLKCVVLSHQSPYHGHKIDQMLRKDYLVQVEMATKTHILGIFSVADTKKGLNQFVKGLKDIDSQGIKDCRRLKHNKSQDAPKLKTGHKDPTWHMAEMVYLPHEVEGLDKEWVGLNETSDRIAGGQVTPYPPGIPWLLPGERMTLQLLTQLNDQVELGVDVLGINEKGQILCIKQ